MQLWWASFQKIEKNKNFKLLYIFKYIFTINSNVINCYLWCVTSNYICLYTSSLVGLRTDFCAGPHTCGRTSVGGAQKKRHCRGQWFSSTLHVEFNELWSIASSGWDTMGRAENHSWPDQNLTNAFCCGSLAANQTRAVPEWLDVWRRIKSGAKWLHSRDLC